MGTVDSCAEEDRCGATGEMGKGEDGEESRVAKCAIITFKKGKNPIKPRTLRKLTKGIHNLQNKSMKN